MKHPRPEKLRALIKAVAAAGVSVRAVEVRFDEDGTLVWRIETDDDRKPADIGEVELG